MHIEIIQMCRFVSAHVIRFVRTLASPNVASALVHHSNFFERNKTNKKIFFFSTFYLMKYAEFDLILMSRIRCRCRRRSTLDARVRVHDIYLNFLKCASFA